MTDYAVYVEDTIPVNNADNETEVEIAARMWIRENIDNLTFHIEEIG